MGRQDVEVVILVTLVGAALACCLLPAVVLHLDLSILLLFVRDGDAVVAKGCRWKGLSISLLVFVVSLFRFCFFLLLLILFVFIVDVVVSFYLFVCMFFFCLIYF